MNSIREINRINERELELGVAGKGSWHDQYKDSAYVFVGGLSYDLTEGDVITIFSQWGEIVDINMPRDKETGKQRGFGFVMYEDQRSTVLAVDNMNGTEILGRIVRVDHCRKYNQPGTKDGDGNHVEPDKPTYNAMPPVLEGSDESDSSESEAADSLDEEDPMAAFLRAQKKEEKQKQKKKTITDGSGKKRKHEGETKEERRVRKEAKRMKKAEKERKKADKGGKVKLEPGEHRKREGERSREADDLEKAKGRANRGDWREGRWELERDEKDKDKDRDRKERDISPRRTHSSRHDEPSRDEHYSRGSHRNGDERHRSRDGEETHKSRDEEHRSRNGSSRYDDQRDWRDRDRNRDRDRYA
ncbi:hypothetical protein BCR39DRAFT_540470 [Naematelia encephala]|uniref:RRM domain-containing protein n=1 Tax=Naematelia encephala TaxID=71784 RepID=A0A1Y2AWT3_9TREE|nr:hypothetical protein BCR39DRAFT_540470 [Naematelia encephala]